MFKNRLSLISFVSIIIILEDYLNLLSHKFSVFYNFKYQLSITVINLNYLNRLDMFSSVSSLKSSFSPRSSFTNLPPFKGEQLLSTFEKDKESNYN